MGHQLRVLLDFIKDNRGHFQGCETLLTGNNGRLAGHDGGKFEGLTWPVPKSPLDQP